MAIKKQYKDIVAILEANKDKKVSSVLEQILAIASASTTRAESTYLKDVNNQVVAIFDYYFKRWMPLVGNLAVDFGKKENTQTGLNTMCKVGVSLWTKQQSQAKKDGQALLSRVANGEVKPEDITVEQAKIEDARKVIAPTELGFATQEELEVYLTNNGVVLTK